MKKVLVVTVVLAFMVGMGILFIEKGPHNLTFYESSSGEAYSNTDIEVIYTKFCPFSPCGKKYRSETIYSGFTDEGGSITLWGHSANEINFNGQGDRILEYTIVVNGQSFKRMDKEKSNSTSIYLIASDDYDVKFSEGEIEILFDWQDVLLRPNTDVTIGEVLYTELSPDEQFLYIRTGQGGGFGGIIYDRDTQIAHILGGQVENGRAWQEDGTLKLYDFEYFGEDAGDIISTYSSRDSQSPWVLIAE
jgi:hypothetical protein